MRWYLNYGNSPVRFDMAQVEIHPQSGLAPEEAKGLEERLRAVMLERLGPHSGFLCRNLN